LKETIMSDPASLDPYVELFGLELPSERLQEVLVAYAGILGEIQKLRSLDLTDVHPAVVFEPTAPYRKTP
jgi:hypothetical protein